MVNSSWVLMQPAEPHHTAGGSIFDYLPPNTSHLTSRVGPQRDDEAFYEAVTFCILRFLCSASLRLSQRRSYTAEASANPMQRELKIGHV